MKRTLLWVAHVTGPLAMRVAQTGVIPIGGVVRHRGRKSGKLHATPIAIRPTPDGFVLPLPWGEGTDWCRNLRAAGGGIVTWGGVDHEITSPEIVDSDAAMPFFNAVLRPVARRIGIKKYLRVRRADVARDVRPLIGRTA